VLLCNKHGTENRQRQQENGGHGVTHKWDKPAVLPLRLKDGGVSQASIEQRAGDAIGRVAFADAETIIDWGLTHAGTTDLEQVNFYRRKFNLPIFIRSKGSF